MKKVLAYIGAVAFGLTLAALVMGVKPRTVTPMPSPEPIPSYVWDMDPGCFTWGQPVAGECLEGGAPLCTALHWGIACWSRDASGDLWYWPQGLWLHCPSEHGDPAGWPCIWTDPRTGAAQVVDAGEYIS